MLTHVSGQLARALIVPAMTDSVSEAARRRFVIRRRRGSRRWDIRPCQWIVIIFMLTAGAELEAVIAWSDWVGEGERQRIAIVGRR
jgi:hypothetical protein